MIRIIWIIKVVAAEVTGRDIQKRKAAAKQLQVCFEKRRTLISSTTSSFEAWKKESWDDRGSVVGATRVSVLEKMVREVSRESKSKEEEQAADFLHPLPSPALNDWNLVFIETYTSWW